MLPQTCRLFASSQGCSHMSRLSHLAEGEVNLGLGVREWQSTTQKVGAGLLWLLVTHLSGRGAGLYSKLEKQPELIL